jgi:hypothetical protein
VLLNREAWEVGNYVMYRLYKEEGLALKRMEPHGSARQCGIARNGSRPQARIHGRRFLEQNPSVRFNFTPTYSS